MYSSGRRMCWGPLTRKGLNLGSLITWKTPMSYCHGLGREIAAEKIPRNTVGMVWKKGHKLARVSLHHVHRKYGYGIRGNWYLNFQKCCSQEQSGRKYRELLPSTSIKLYIVWCTIQIYRKTKIWTMTISDLHSRFRQLKIVLLLRWGISFHIFFGHFWRVVFKWFFVASTAQVVIALCMCP